jgi:hypothetical protein
MSTLPLVREVEIEKIARLPSQLAHLLRGISAEELADPFISGEWSVAQNIHHLADSHMNSYIRCKLILTEEEPPLKPYDQDRWAALPDGQMQDVELSLDILRGLHTRWVLFWSSLREDEWRRTGYHPESGMVTLADQLRIYAAHGEAHMAQIRRTVGAQYTSLPATKEELLARIDREWERLSALTAYLSSEEMETAIDGGWTPKAHVAHIAGWEKCLIRHTIGGEPLHIVMQMDADDFEPADVDRINAVLEARTHTQLVSEVLEEAQRTHAAARVAIVALDWAAWTHPLHENEPSGEPKLSKLACDTYEHYLEHWQSLPVR